MDKDKVLKLASLARLKMSGEEAEHLSQEFEAILNYVSEVKSVSAERKEPVSENFAVRNIMREDANGHEPGAYSEVLIASAPAREGDYIKVKKIL